MAPRTGTKSDSPVSAQNPSVAPPPLPPRPPVLVFLTSEKTQRGAAALHSMSGEAVKLSSRTINAIDNMIRRTMGMKNRRTKYFSSSSEPSGPGAASLAAPFPPPYEAVDKSRSASPQFYPEKYSPPPILPRSSPFAVPPPLPSRSEHGSSTSPISAALPHQPILTSKERILMSMDLILSTVDDSARRLLDSAPTAVGKVMAHK